MRLNAIRCMTAAGIFLLAACSSSGIPATNPASNLTSSFTRIGNAAGGTNVLKNPCFATGKLSPWTAVGKAPGEGAISTAEVHVCKYSALMGTTAPPAVDGIHGIEQSVKIPAKATLTWWYYGDSNDNIKYGNQEVDLMSGTKLVYQCFKKLVTTKKWTEGTCNLSKYAGKTYDLVLGVDDNGYSKTYVYWYVDDLSLASS